MNILKIAILAFMALPLSTFAQQKKSSMPMTFGIKLGANLASINTQSTISKENLVGINSGLVLGIPLRTNITLQPELCFMGSGAILTYSNNLIDGTVKYNLNYIQLPILLDYKLNKFIHFHAGPNTSLLLTSDVKNNLANNKFDFQKNIEYSDFNKLDFGIIGGASIHYKDVSLGLRYNLGLINVANDKTILGSNYSFANGSNRVASVYFALTP